MALFKTKARQATTTIAPEGDESYVASTRLGQIFTSDWRQKLVLDGRCYRFDVGTFSTGADVALVTGGGDGLVIDFNQPEICIGVDVGYYMLPLEVMVAAQVEQDADANEANIIVIADRTKAVPTSITTATIGTVTNLLGGGPAFPGRAFHSIKSDIPDPDDDELLDFATIQASDFISDGSSTSQTNGVTAALRLHYEPEMPSIVKGPCGLYVLWGGTIAVKAIATVVIAVVPDSWFS